MNKVIKRKYNSLSIFLTFFVLSLGMFYSTCSAANGLAQSSGNQLAYFVGYHSYYGSPYYRPAYIHHGPRYVRHKTYWTGWRYIGYGCRKKCLIDRWSGRAIRCSKRC